jgi:hypothetical protein
VVRRKKTEDSGEWLIVSDFRLLVSDFSHLSSLVTRPSKPHRSATSAVAVIPKYEILSTFHFWPNFPDMRDMRDVRDMRDIRDTPDVRDIRDIRGGRSLAAKRVFDKYLRAFLKKCRGGDSSRVPDVIVIDLAG